MSAYIGEWILQWFHDDILGDFRVSFTWITNQGSIADYWEILTIGYYTVLLMYNPSWLGTHYAN